MRILVVGAGAVGGFFGSKLVQAGRDVTFLVRPARADRLRSDGLRVRTLKGDEVIVDVQVVTADELAPFDLIVFAVKSYSVEQALDDIAGAVGEGTIILPALNGMAHIDALRSRFGAEKVVGGVCIVAAQVDEDGSIRQVGPGSALSYGEFDGLSTDRMLAVDAALAGAGFRTTLSSTIELDMWEKWMLLAAGGALTTLFRSPVGPIVAAPGGVDAALAIADETFAISAAAGFAPRTEARERVTSTLTEPGSAFATSMFRDQSQGRDVEADHIVGDLVARGRDFGVSSPVLQLAYTSLCVYRESRHAG